MQLITLYFSTLIPFLALDALGITKVIKPLFDRHVGALLADEMRVGPALGFYLVYIAGVLWFVSWPALQAGKLGAIGQVFCQGALLGALCYATYEMTNFATLKGWHWSQVLVDTSWGAVLTGSAAALGLWLTQLATRSAPPAL